MNESRATRYHRLKRRAVAGSQLAGAAFLLAALAGPSQTLRDIVAAGVDGVAAPPWLAPWLVVALYVGGLALAYGLCSLPFAFYLAFALERRYGLSVQRAGDWLRQHVKAFAVALGLGLAGAELVYACLRAWPDRWWLFAAAAFSGAIVVLARVGPTLLLPLFYRLRPLHREALSDRLVALARRMGTPVVGVYEWGFGERTRRANAALVGVGRSRRILLSDTLLSEYSDDEIEVILAHELAHHVHADIWKGIAYETALAFGGFYAAHWLLAALGGRLALAGPADVAGLPLLLLAGAAVSLLLLPCANAASRAFERRADRAAIELTGKPAAFVSAMRRLGAQNLAEERPSTLVRVLFLSHPPVAERIAAAEQVLTNVS
jgi:STE24 endopeptidase